MDEKKKPSLPVYTVEFVFYLLNLDKISTTDKHLILTQSDTAKCST